MSTPLLSLNNHDIVITVSGPQAMKEQCVGMLGLVCYLAGSKGHEKLHGRMVFPRDNPALCLEMLGMIHQNLLPVGQLGLHRLLMEHNAGRIVPASADVPLPPPPQGKA